MLISLEQIFIYKLNKHPCLYLSDSLFCAKMKIYDSILNVIGNGIRSVEDLYDDISLSDVELFELKEKYVSEVDLYRCYFTDDRRSADYYLVLTEEEANRNQFIVSKSKIKKNNFEPYPNFQKKYSIVWTPEIDKFDLPSLKEILWFYQECLKYFNSEHKYSIFIRAKDNTPQFDNLVINYKDKFKKFFDESETEEEAFELISKSYNCQFKGDIKEFIFNKANSELNYALTFINETINMIENKINNY